MSPSKALPIHGILLVNKPTNLTSNAVLQKVKRLFNAKKAGHTGSLDPLATGMLPLCFGEATKFCQYLLDADKAYYAKGLLGIKTTTADSQGEITHQLDNFIVTTAELKAVIETFIGPIMQIPSMFSALKHQGKPLYRLAREGITIERKAREIVIENMELLDFDGKIFSIKVFCSKGTYIRNLVEEIGEKLGVYAHLTELHRDFTAGFSKECMYTVEELMSMSEEDRLNCLLPSERAVIHLPGINVSEEEAQALSQGKKVSYQHSNNLAGCVRLYLGSRFMGLGDLSENSELRVRRLLSTVLA